MTYSNKFVAVIKASGKILRESSEGIVTIPFGSEYNILLKNLNSKKANVSISIDGVSIGNDLIMESNTTTELERFIGTNLTSGNRFRFIQKTQEIVNHRGDRVDDGVIRIEVKYEKDKPVVVDHYDYWHYNSWPTWTPPKRRSDDVYTSRDVYNVANSGGSTGGSTFTYNTGEVLLANANASPCYTVLTSNIQPDEGLTVKGSHSNQQFQYGYIGELEPNSDVIILRLRGTRAEVEIHKPITVKTKLVCETCGKHNKSNQAFCGRCGTSLS